MNEFNDIFVVPDTSLFSRFIRDKLRQLMILPFYPDSFKTQDTVKDFDPGARFSNHLKNILGTFYETRQPEDKFTTVLTLWTISWQKRNLRQTYDQLTVVLTLQTKEINIKLTT